MATAVDRYQIEVDVNPGVQALNRLQGQLKNATSAFDQLRNTLGSLALTAFTTNAIQSARALDDFSKSSGIAVGSLLALTKAVKESNGNQDQAIDAFGQFASKLKEAAAGSKEAQDAFAKVGISLNDLRTLSNEALLEKTFQGLRGMEDNVTRLGAQMGLFGEEFRKVNTNAGGVADQLERVRAEAERNAPSIQAAAEASRNFDRAVSNLQTAILNIIEPFTRFIGSLDPATIKFFSDAVIKLGAAFLALKAINIVAPLLTSLTLTMLTTTNAVRGLMTALGVTAAWDSAKTGAYQLSAAFQGIINSTKVASGGFKMFGASIMTALAGLLRFLPIIGQVAAALMILNDAVDLLTGKSLVGWADEAAASVSKLLGIEYKTEEEKAKIKKTEDDLKKAAEERAAATRQVQDAMAGEKASLESSLKSYQLQNRLANERYALETKLIGVGEGRAERERQLADAYANYQQERIKLLDQISAKERTASTSPSDAAMIPKLKEALGQLDAEYQKQKASIEQLTAAREAATRANNLATFGTESLVNSNRQLAEIQTQIATALLPELQRRYVEIEAQAKASAEAAIAAEEARRKSALSEEERNKYLEAAAVKVRELQAAEYELAKVQRERRLIDFGYQEQIDNERKLRELQHEMSNALLPERARIEKDLVFQARERAKAEIDAENARRGRGNELSPEEEAKYYEAAEKGLRKVITATEEHYDMQREWSTGWRKAFQDYADDATKASQQASRIFQKTTKGMEDMIVNFAKTGKFEWKGFINSILEELLRSQIQQLIAQTFGGISGGKSSGGGLFSSIGNMLGFANGGMIPTNQPVLVGERGPEILTGAGGRTVIPNEQIGGGQTVVTYNINAVDAASFKQMIARDPQFLYAVSEQGRRSLPGGR